MIPQTDVDIRVARHEAAHATAAYLVLGPDAIADKGVTRVPKGGRLGKTHMTIPEEAFAWKNSALLAADIAVVLLAAVKVEPGDGTVEFNTDVDVATVSDRLAPIAYGYVTRVDDVDAWRTAWMGRVSERVDELLDSRAFWRALNALELRMDLSPTMSGANVCATFEEALRPRS